MTNLSVAVVIAAKNAETTIGAAIVSALKQEHVEEIIVVDDGSTDATAAAATSAGQGSSKLQVLRLPHNVGPSAARNVALDRVISDAICVLDADDFMLPDRISKLAGYFDGCDFVADDLFYIAPPDDMIRERRLFCDLDELPQFLTLAQLFERSLSRPGAARGEIAFVKPLMSRAFLVGHGLRYRENMRLAEDFALYAEALQSGARFRLVPACGYVSVERSDSLSAQHSIKDLANFLAFDDEMLRRPLSEDARAALAAHRLNTAIRLAHRELLKAKRDKDVRAVVKSLLGSPRVGAGVARAIVRDKLGI